MLVTMKEILTKANEENYAVAAPNVCTELDTRACIEAAEELQAPLIIDIAANANSDMYFLAQICRELAVKSNVPVAVNLDHGGSYEEIIEAVRSGFTGIMVDRSNLSFKENVKQVREIVEIAHAVGISVEAELGHVGDAGQYDMDRDAALTDANDARRFIQETGVDCLAVAIGTAHGAYPDHYVPYLDFDRLKEIKQITNGFPLVLHGSSGTRNEDLCKVCSMGINKVNICSDLNQAAWDAVLEGKASEASTYDFYTLIHDGIKKKLKQVNELYGSSGKAWKPVNHGLIRKEISMKEG